MQDIQLLLWKPTFKPTEFFREDGTPCYPFQIEGKGWIWGDLEMSYAGRNIYWDYITRSLLFSPHVLRVSVWSDPETNKLMSSYRGVPDEVKAIWAERRERDETEAFNNFVPVAPKKPRKPYKWSKKAKIRNRQRLLRKRIEKKHGYNPNRPDLFDGEILLAIEADFQEAIHDNPDYFIKGLYTRGRDT